MEWRRSRRRHRHSVPRKHQIHGDEGEGALVNIYTAIMDEGQVSRYAENVVPENPQVEAQRSVLQGAATEAGESDI